MLCFIASFETVFSTLPAGSGNRYKYIVLKVSPCLTRQGFDKLLCNYVNISMDLMNEAEAIRSGLWNNCTTQMR